MFPLYCLENSMNIKLFKNICYLTQDKLLLVMTKFLKEKYEKVISTKDYVIAVGQRPVCLCAHLDTVEKIPPVDIYHDKEQNILWSPQLLGADDRAGVYAIIQIIEDGFLPTVILTTNEEKGCLGSQKLIQDYPSLSDIDKSLTDLKAIFQLDRRNRKDCVFYDCDNIDFADFVEIFGFETAIGSFSDISVIAPAWGVAAANLSVGYENEHLYIELLHTDWLEETIDKVEAILRKALEMKKFIYIPAAKYSFPIDKVSEYAKALNPLSFCGICYKDLTKEERVKICDDFYCCKDCYMKYMFEPPSDDIDDVYR